jgi:hypothetical protein
MVALGLLGCVLFDSLGCDNCVLRTDLSWYGAIRSRMKAWLDWTRLFGSIEQISSSWGFPFLCMAATLFDTFLGDCFTCLGLVCFRISYFITANQHCGLGIDFASLLPYFLPFPSLSIIGASAIFLSLQYVVCLRVVSHPVSVLG